MNDKKGKWLLAVVALCCLAPAAFAIQAPAPKCPNAVGCKPAVQVPEGGSTAIYLFGAGLTCFGAMFLRSRLAKRTQS
jgi:hypothetical protein